jgi:hypothetical protein
MVKARTFEAGCSWILKPKFIVRKAAYLGKEK